MIDNKTVSGLLKTDSVDVICLESIDSTNNEAKRLLADGTRERTIIIANRQTGGRGRNGKSFASPADTGLYMSLIAFPNTRLCDTVYLTTKTAVAVAEAIEQVTGKAVGIKWVNDIYYGGKKAGGILTEAVSVSPAGVVESVVIGIGLNLHTAEFPDEIADIATSLNVDWGQAAALAATIADLVFAAVDNLSDTGYLDEYRKRSIVIGKELLYSENGAWHTATALGIDETGGLIIEKPDGTRETLRSGEISVRLC